VIIPYKIVSAQGDVLQVVELPKGDALNQPLPDGCKIEEISWEQSRSIMAAAMSANVE
jgi:hypothetical protein